MKRVTGFLIAIFLTAGLVGAAPSAFADDAGHKLTRGLVNIVSSPVEVGRTIVNVSNDQGAATGWTWGLLKGLGRTGLRLGAGLVETVTFPFDWPNADKEPIIEPEYAWQSGTMKV